MMRERERERERERLCLWVLGKGSEIKILGWREKEIC